MKLVGEVIPILLIIAMAATMTLAGVTPVSAQPSEVWVDDDYLHELSGTGGEISYFASDDAYPGVSDPPPPSVPVWSIGDNWVYNCSYENPGGKTEQDTCELDVTVVGEEVVGDEACYKCSGVFDPAATRDAADMPLTLHVETADIWTSKAHMEYLKTSSAIAELPGLPSTVTWNYTEDYGWPYDVGKTWNASVHVVAGVLDEITELEVRVLGVETITVPAGTFECYHIVAYEPTSPDDYTFEHWFNTTEVKSVVKEIDRFLWAGEETKELTSYSGGTPPARNLPDSVQRGETFNVSVNFTAPADEFNCITLTDLAPYGWDVTVDKAWCTPNADLVKATDNQTEIAWVGPGVGFDKNTSFSALYKVTVPDDAPAGIYTFNGFLGYFIGVSGQFFENVTGDSEVEVTTFVPVWSVGDNWVYNCSYENPGGETEEDTSELTVTVVGEEVVGDEACYKLSGVFDPAATRDAADLPLTLHVGTADIWTSKDKLVCLKLSSSIAELPGLPSTVTWTLTGDYGYPFEVGKTWSGSVRVVAGVLDEITDLEFEVLGEETITVPAGTFDCWHLVVSESGSPGTYVNEYWINTTEVKSVVKEIERALWAGEETRELTSYSVGTPPARYNLTINSTSGGNVTTPGEGTFTCNASEVVDLVATPDSGYHFVNWAGDVGTIGNVNSRATTITMNGDYFITANFAEGAVEVDSEWGKVDTPYRGDWTIAPNSDILVSATIPGGSVIYVVGKGHDDNNLDSDWGPRLWKSEDSGVTWDDLADNVWDADGLPASFNPSTSYFNYVACALDDSDFVAVAVVDDNNTGVTYCDDEQAVVISDDGGENFAWTGDIDDSSAGSILTRVFSMTISEEDAYGKRNIALGGVGDAGSCPDGLVFRYQTGGLTGGHWVDASAYDDWDNINDTAADIDSEAVTTVQFAPSWLADRTVLAVSHTVNGTYLQSGTWGNTTAWNEPAGFEPAVQIVADESMWSFFRGAATGIALPTDYEGRHASTRYAWVYVDGTDGNGTIYRATNGAVVKVNMQISGNFWLASLSYLGSIDEGKAIAGLLGDGIGYPTECCEGVQVYFNDGIVDMDICCERWSDACKPPTGTMAAMVFYVLPNKAYAFVSGIPHPSLGYDESAVSFSMDDGDTWNQLGLVDTYIDYLSDVAKSADCSKTWVVSVNASIDHYCVCDSVWLKADPLPEASEYSGAWIREWCGDLEGSPEEGLLRLAPEETGEALTVYLVDRWTDTVYYDGNEGLGCWEQGSSTVDEISDLAIQDEAIIYALGFDADVAVSDDHGAAASWSSTMDSKVDHGHTITVLGEGNVLVGGADGKVSYSDDDLATFLDGEASFTELDDIGEGNVHVAFDSYFDTNSVIYAAVSWGGDDNGIYRWVIDESTNWTDLGDCAGTATPTETQLGLGPSCTPVEVGYYGIVLSDAEGNPETDATTGGILYAAYAWEDNATGVVYTGVARCLNPAEEVACGEATWDYLIQGLSAENDEAFASEPSSLKICGCLTPYTSSRLWAIDWYSWYYGGYYGPDFATDDEDSGLGRLWTYSEAPEISVSPSNLTFVTRCGENPADQTLEVCNSVSGTLNWSLSDNAGWLSETPTSGSLGEGECEDMTVSVNTSGMNVGLYFANITITGSANVTIPVTLEIKASSDVMRNLPDVTYPGGTFDVFVSFTAPVDEFNAIGLTDLAPDGWEVAVDTAWCTPNADLVKATDNKAEIAWFGEPDIGFYEGTNFTAMYKVTVPDDAELGINEFPLGDCSKASLFYFIGPHGPYRSCVIGEHEVTVIVTIDVMRNLPDDALDFDAEYPEDTFDVYVNFTAPVADFNSIGLTDFAPPGWLVETNDAWCTPAASWNKSNYNKAEYAWAGPYSAGQNFTAKYKVTIPATASAGINEWPNCNISEAWVEYWFGAEGPYESCIMGDYQKIVTVPGCVRGETRDVNADLLDTVTVVLYEEPAEMGDEPENSDSSTMIPTPVNMTDAGGNFTTWYENCADDTGYYYQVASKYCYYPIDTSNMSLPRNASYPDYIDWSTPEKLATGYRMDFEADYGLICKGADMSYAMTSVNHWLFVPVDQYGAPHTEWQIHSWKAMESIHAWQYPCGCGCI